MWDITLNDFVFLGRALNFPYISSVLVLEISISYDNPTTCKKYEAICILSWI